MAKKTENEFELKQVQGVCRFCGQFVALEVPQSFTQEDIDDQGELQGKRLLDHAPLSEG